MPQSLLGEVKLFSWLFFFPMKLSRTSPPLPTCLLPVFVCSGCYNPAQYYTLSVLNNKNLRSHNSGGQKSKAKVSAESVPS